MFKQVRAYCHGDMIKTLAWFNTYNTVLCAVPMEMIRAKRTAKLEKFINEELLNRSP